MFSIVQQSVTNEQPNDVKKRKLSNDNSSKIKENISPKILSRSYLLTKTGYKYLDIGIIVSTPSRVEIALGNNYGREIHLSYSVWKNLMNQRDIISRFFKNDVDEAPSQTIGHVVLSFGKINNMKVICLETPTLCLNMTSQTACNMFALENCVDCINQSLNSIIGMVDVKYARFLEITKDAKNPNHVIHKSDLFDKNNIIDCELVTQVFARL